MLVLKETEDQKLEQEGSPRKEGLAGRAPGARLGTNLTLQLSRTRELPGSLNYHRIISNTYTDNNIEESKSLISYFIKYFSTLFFFRDPNFDATDMGDVSLGAYIPTLDEGEIETNLKPMFIEYYENCEIDECISAIAKFNIGMLVISVTSEVVEGNQYRRGCTDEPRGNE